MRECTPLCAHHSVRQAKSNVSTGARVTSQYAEELETIKKNFEALKRGLPYSVAPSLPPAQQHPWPTPLPAAATTYVEAGRAFIHVQARHSHRLSTLSGCPLSYVSWRPSGPVGLGDLSHPAGCVALRRWLLLMIMMMMT